MKYTRQELIERINKNDIDFFQNFYNGYWEDEDAPENNYEQVWNLNWGDGNDLFIAIKFPDEGITVYMEGIYSSYDDNRFQKVSLAVPFQYTETRYRPATADEIRDMRIDEILN
jgi:hypothetical protein